MSAPFDRPVSRGDELAFSRPFRVDDLPDGGVETSIEALAAECAAVAEEIGLPSVDTLTARFRIIRQSGGRVHVDGQVKARVTQICVISLDAFESDITQSIEIIFAPIKAPLPEHHARHANKRDAARTRADLRASSPPASVGDGEADPPDPIVDGRIDLGAVAVEFLTLALEFYPKKPGVHFSDVVIGETDEPTPSAFAALERFKDRS